MILFYQGFGIHTKRWFGFGISGCHPTVIILPSQRLEKHRQTTNSKEILDVKEQVPRFQEELRCPVQLQWIEAGHGVEGKNTGKKRLFGWWFQILPGEMIQFDKHIFQRGWFNHQLAMDFFLDFWMICCCGF